MIDVVQIDNEDVRNILSLLMVAFEKSMSADAMLAIGRAIGRLEAESGLDIDSDMLSEGGG